MLAPTFLEFTNYFKVEVKTKNFKSKSCLVIYNFIFNLKATLKLKVFYKYFFIKVLPFLHLLLSFTLLHYRSNPITLTTNAINYGAIQLQIWYTN